MPEEPVTQPPSQRTASGAIPILMQLSRSEEPRQWRNCFLSLFRFAANRCESLFPERILRVAFQIPGVDKPFIPLFEFTDDHCELTPRDDSMSCLAISSMTDALLKDAIET